MLSILQRRCKQPCSWTERLRRFLNCGKKIYIYSMFKEESSLNFLAFLLSLKAPIYMRGSFKRLHLLQVFATEFSFAASKLKTAFLKEVGLDW